MVLLLILTPWLSGCAWLHMRPVADDVPTKDASPGRTPAPTPTEPLSTPTPLKQLRKANFQGWYLTVLVDGRQTRPADISEKRQVWQAGNVSPTPSVEFVLDREALGGFLASRISLRPVRDGRPVLDELWLPAESTAARPLERTRLSGFRQVRDNEITHHDALPPGRYRLILHIRGEQNWDQQYIDLQIGQ
jgi:hypothetical protein